jgi:phenol hydroxylase P4 protein
MPVASIGDYDFAPRDHAGIYGDNQIVYFCWEGHLLFAAPFITFVPRDTKLGQYLDETIRPLLGPDPDAGALDWNSARWSNGPNPFTPDFGATLLQNGIGHKHKIIMSTPGLNTLLPDS